MGIQALNSQPARQFPPTWYEEILVVPRDILFAEGDWQGVQTGDYTSFMEHITQHGEFHPRYNMEEDERYKQIIPYAVFVVGDEVFVMERRAKMSEQRLASKLSIGIGGHVQASDIGSKDIFDWTKREFLEEIDYGGNILKIEPIGIINDDADAVGRVHCGLARKIVGDSRDIKVKEELAGGFLVAKSELLKFADRMEPWSKLLVEHL